MTNKEEIYLYDGSIRLKFDGRKHTYRICGLDDNEIIVPSVTQILGVVSKPALVPWAVKETVEYLKTKVEPGKTYCSEELTTTFLTASMAHIKKKEEAADIGTQVHAWIEDYTVSGGQLEMPKDENIRCAIKKFLGWVKENEVEFILAEQPVYSQEHGYSGTLDFTARIAGRLWLGDTKTSNGIYETYPMQTAAYQLARIEEHPEENYYGQMIIRIGKDGSFEFRPIYTYEENRDTFLAALSLFNGVNRLKEELGLNKGVVYV